MNHEAIRLGWEVYEKRALEETKEFLKQTLITWEFIWAASPPES